MTPASEAVVTEAPGAGQRIGFRAELADLRERMRRLGLGFDDVAGEIGRRYRLRPRESYRLAGGLSLLQAAARFNTLAAREGTDPQGRAAMTGPHLCEHEHWPSSSGRKPSVYVLIMLAQMYETDVLSLLDLADHENLAPQDRLTLIRRPPPRAETEFGRKLVALANERGLSLREVARRVPCSAAHLSNIAHGRKGASEQLAGLLDRVLDAGGELEALAEPAARDDNDAGRGHAPGQSAEGTFQQLAGAAGLSLSLPYVPGRLLIEIAEPAVSAGQGSPAAYPGRVNGQLALIRDLGHEAQRDGAGVPGA